MLYFTFDLMIYMFTLQIFLRKNFDGLSNRIPMLKGKLYFQISHTKLYNKLKLPSQIAKKNTFISYLLE